MIKCLADLVGTEYLEPVIKELNRKFHGEAWIPVRYSFSELRRIAEYMERNGTDWSLEYQKTVLSGFNSSEIEFIKLISKAVDDKDTLLQLQKQVKCYNQQVTRNVQRVLGEMQLKEPVSKKIRRIFHA